LRHLLALRAQIADDDLLERRRADLGPVIGRRGMTSQQARRLAVRLTDLDDLALCSLVLGATRATHENMLANQRVGIAGDPYASTDEDHDVLADALDVGEDVRREDHARSVLRDDAHELFEELEARDGIEIRHGLV
jgi:hypothetical protein